MRIQGITIDDNKQVGFGLTAIFGIGRSRAASIAKKAGVDVTKKIKDLTEKEEVALRTLVEEFTIEGDLRREVSTNIKRLKDIGSYRGDRHSRHLPTRGQRTKTNSRTVRGNKRVTMGSGKIVATKK